MATGKGKTCRNPAARERSAFCLCGKCRTCNDLDGRDGPQMQLRHKTWLDFTGRPLEAELGDGWVERSSSGRFEPLSCTYTEAFKPKRVRMKMHYRVAAKRWRYRWVLDYGVPRFNPDRYFSLAYIALHRHQRNGSTQEEVSPPLGAG